MYCIISLTREERAELDRIAGLYRGRSVATLSDVFGCASGHPELANESLRLDEVVRLWAGSERRAHLALRYLGLEAEPIGEQAPVPARRLPR